MDPLQNTYPCKKDLVAYIVSQELANISSLLPSNKKRSLVVHSLINAMGLMSPGFSESRRLQVINPRRATIKDLSVYHSRDYLDFVLDPGNSSHAEQSTILVNAEFGLEDDCPPFRGLADYVQLIGGASLTAANALRQDVAEIALCWDGGRHHAQKSHASGFCYVADCILAILTLKRPLPVTPSTPQPSKKSRIMYLDIDLHFSDAVSEAFYSSNSSSVPQILTLSVHHTAPGFFPVSPRAYLPDIADPAFDPFTLSIPLREGASNSTYHRIWPCIERIKDIFDPDYIVMQCGADALAGDPCATFNWSLGDGPGSLGWCVRRVLGWKGKKLLLGGGGYHSANAARAWTYLTSIALDKPLDLDTEIPDHSGFPLYEPSFTLDVPAGNMRDHNSDENIKTIVNHFENMIPYLQRRLNT